MNKRTVSGLIRGIRSGFERLQSIPYPDTSLTPETWCDQQPCRRVTIRGREIILSQPASTFWVYALGILTLGVAYYFLRISEDSVSRQWWGISLMFWGVGALLAGTSYQLFGYEIKCRGRSVCAWTSWWEVIYLMFQQMSISAMLAAVAYSCSGGALQTGLLSYAVVSAVLYVIVVFIAGLVPIKSLITFELMVLVSVPPFVFFLLINSWRYYFLGRNMDLVLLGTWVLLALIMLAYLLSCQLGISRRLWAQGKGFWFSENDVLHIGLILWMIYIAFAVADRITDFKGAGLAL